MILRAILIIIFFPINLICQDVSSSIASGTLIGINYGYQIPGADLAESFGNNSSVGINPSYKFGNNFSLGLQGTFFWGNEVKQDVEILRNMLTSNGSIINQFGEYSIFSIFERGFTITAEAGKLFDVIGPNPNSGILLKLGVGFMRHKIAYRVENENVPLLRDDYLKLYDRLTFGTTLSQFIGYQHLSNNRQINFYIGFESYQGFTKGRRDAQADLEGPYNDNRFELQWGIRAGWILPIYSGTKNKNDYYYD